MKNTFISKPRQKFYWTFRSRRFATMMFDRVHERIRFRRTNKSHEYDSWRGVRHLLNYSFNIWTPSLPVRLHYYQSCRG